MLDSPDGKSSRCGTVCLEGLETGQEKQKKRNRPRETEKEGGPIGRLTFDAVI
jgi:hypothetical protein